MGSRDRMELTAASERAWASRPRRIVVAGAGVAGVRCAFELRRRGFDGAVTIIGEEPELPYDRTLLSTELLTAKRELRYLHSAEDYADRDIDLRLGVRATRLAPGEVELSDGSRLTYDRLVVCTGGRASMPSPLSENGVITLRTAADAWRLRDVLTRCERLVVIGGGFIGSEIASAARERGLSVVMVERDDTPFESILGTDVGKLIRSLQESFGIEVRCGTTARGIQKIDGEYHVRLGDGDTCAGDAVVVSVGMMPENTWLSTSDVQTADGIVTDAYCRTTMPGVLAAGDCARWHHPVYGTDLRFEHWDTAAKHGAAAGRCALGVAEPFAPIPMFWSEQNGSKFQCVGRLTGWNEVRLEQRPGAGFVAHYFRDGMISATFAVDQPEEIARTRTRLREHFEELLT